MDPKKSTISSPGFKVEVGDGKYTILRDDFGYITVLQDGHYYGDRTGDNLILAMARDLYDLNKTCDKQVNRVIKAEEETRKLNSEKDKIIAELYNALDAILDCITETRGPDAHDQCENARELLAKYKKA